MLPYIVLLVALIPTIRYKGKSEISHNIAIVFWCFMAVLIAGLRGDFTADFSTYNYWFEKIGRMDFEHFSRIFNLDFHMDYLELGYILVNFLVSRFTDNYMWMQLIIACMTYIPICIWCKKSNSTMLSLLLFISVGTYLEGFNTVRNMLAASIFVLSIKYIIEEDIKKYTLTVVIASFFHLSALIMLPMYFVLKGKLTVKKLIAYLLIIVLGIISMEELARFYNSFFLISTESGLTALLYRRQADFTTIVFHLVLVITTLVIYFFAINKKIIKNNSVYVNVLMNGTLIWGLIKFTMLYSAYTTRFAAYFSSFIILGLPMVLNKLEKKLRRIMYVILVVLCAIYFLITTKSYGEYYTLLQ